MRTCWRLGFGIAAVLFAYLETAGYTPFTPAMITVSLIPCPASALSAGFLDIQPHSAEAVLAWLVIAAINGALYGGSGYAAGKYVLRPLDVGSGTNFTGNAARQIRHVELKRGMTSELPVPRANWSQG